MDYDVVVVGAGPGGSITARTLAEAGVSVLLVEKRPEIGMPVRCGEGTGIIGLKEMGIKPDPKFIAQETYGDFLFSPDGTKVDMRTEEPTGYVIERRQFDKHLAVLAAKAGAIVRVRTTATGLIMEDGFVKGVKLRHFNDEFEAKCKVVVGADGIEGRIGRWAGINNRTRLGEMASNIQFEMVGIEMEDSRVLEFYLGGKYAPEGYVWVFPKGPDVANVGLGIRKSKETALRCLNRFVADHENLSKGSIAGIVVGGVPVEGPMDKSVGNGVVLVGDSVRQIDPLTGGGIYNAMHCGTLAAGVIKEALDAGDFSSEFLQKYHDMWWKDIGEALTRSLRVKEILEKLGDDELNQIARFMQGMKFGDIDIKEASSIVTQFPPELSEFVQSLF